MILKLMGLARRSELIEATEAADKFRDERDYYKKDAMFEAALVDSLLEQNIALGEAYEDLKRDRDRLQRKLKVSK